MYVPPSLSSNLPTTLCCSGWLVFYSYPCSVAIHLYFGFVDIDSIFMHYWHWLHSMSLLLCSFLIHTTSTTSTSTTYFSSSFLSIYFIRCFNICYQICCTSIQPKVEKLGKMPLCVLGVGGGFLAISSISFTCQGSFYKVKGKHKSCSYWKYYNWFTITCN